MDSKGHDVEPLRIRKFEVGDLVFAKLKGYPPWPSKINQIESLISGGKEKIRYNVYFYGTHQSSILRSSSLYHYDTYAKSIVEKWGRKPKFHEALKELEREMMDKITYLNQLRTTTPESTWCHGFSNACESLASEIDGAQHKAKSKSHCKPARKSTPDVEEIEEIEEESIDDTRKLGYEVMSVERIPFPDTAESLFILSLNFNKDWVKEESQRIKEEERMMNCYVRIEPLPPLYAHLDPVNRDKATSPKALDQEIEEIEDRSLWARSLGTNASSGKKNISSSMRVQKTPVKEIYKQTDQSRQDTRDCSDSDLEEAVETCPVCRLCFFTQEDLKDHEKSVHGAVSTAESLFDQLITANKTDRPRPFSWKEGYPVDSIIGGRA